MINKNIIYIAALSLVMPLLSVIAGEDESKQQFKYIDADGSGFISKSEATQNVKLRENWISLDINKDEKLSEKEFEKFASMPNEPFPEQ